MFVHTSNKTTLTCPREGMSKVSTKNDLINIQKEYVNERLYLVKPPTTFKCVYVSPKCKNLNNITFASPKGFFFCQSNQNTW